jgi:hypothetical protein
MAVAWVMPMEKPCHALLADLDPYNPPFIRKLFGGQRDCREQNQKNPQCAHAERSGE